MEAFGDTTRLPLGANIPVPVGFQVLLGVGTLLVLLVASLVLAIVLVGALTHKDRRLSTHLVPYATALDEGALTAKGAANDSRGFLLSGNTLYIEEFGDRVDLAREAFSKAESHATTGRGLALTSEIRVRFERWVRATQREFQLYVSGHRRAAEAAALGPDRAIRKEYESGLTTAGRLAREDIRAAETSYAGASRRAVMLLLIFLVASLGIGVAVTVWVVRKILAPVYAVLRIFSGLELEARAIESEIPEDPLGA